MNVTREYTKAEVRAWGRANGYEVGERGRVSELLEARYVAAGAPEMAVAAPAQRPRPPKAESGAQGFADTVSADTLRVLGENDYDPRAFLFDADSLTVCEKKWGFKSVREVWTVEQLTALAGEPSLIPTMAGLPEKFADEILGAL